MSLVSRTILLGFTAVAITATIIALNPHRSVGLPAPASWTYTTGDQIGSSPAVAGGIVYIGS